MSETTTAAPTPPQKKRAGVGRWIARILIALLVLVVLLIAVIIGALLYFHIPSNASGMAAKSICSAAFVAGRDEDATTLMEQDVLPASPVLSVISTEIDDQQHTVTAKFLGLFPRQASLVTDRGCVLDLAADPGAQPYTPKPDDPRAWPEGDGVAKPAEQPEGVDTAALEKVVEQAFVGEGDPKAANARGVAVVQDGRLLALREGKGLPQNVALHGWSMTKSVAAMLAYAQLQNAGVDVETPVVDAFPEGREPSWVAQWRQDNRAQITVADLFFMRDGLALDEGYDPWGSVVQMLYGEPDMASWAAEHPADHEPGTYWEYLSATSNILAQVIQARFPNDQEYWTDPITMFDQIGATTATLETDTTGTWVGSSYLWASTADWARLGQLMLDDGRWDGRAVLPPGFLKFTQTPAMPDGEGHGYGAQTWLLGDPIGGECKDYPGVPKDTVAMEGHWGQLVATVPSYDAVIVRLGWTFSKSQFDGCQFLSDTVATLKKP